MNDSEPSAFLNFDRFVLVVAGSALAASLYFLAFADSIEDGSGGALVGKVSMRKGDVRRRSQTATSWSEAHEGDSLHEGDGVFTGDGSRIEITLERGDQFGVDEKSLVVMHATSGQVELDLRYGSLVSRIVSGRKIVLNIDGRRQEVAGDRAKIRLQRTSRDAFAQIEVLEGEVDLHAPPTASRAQTNTRKIVRKSETARIGESVTALPLPPVVKEAEIVKIESPGLTNPTIAWTFPRTAGPHEGNHQAPATGVPPMQWTKIPSAARYQIEIARSLDFVKAEKFQSIEPSWQLAEAALGPLYWRVSAIAADGRESSVSSTGTWQLGAAAPFAKPVAVIERVFDQQKDFDEAKVQAPLAWERVAWAAQYETQVISGPGISTPRNARTTSLFSNASLSKPGTYSWRVRSLDTLGAPISEWSNLSEFVYRNNLKLRALAAIPPAPVIIPQTIGLEAPRAFEPRASTSVVAVGGAPIFVNFSWARTAGAIYELQIASDELFTLQVRKLDLRKSTYFFNEHLASGAIYWRVRNKFGEQISPWSPTIRFNVIAR